LVAVSDAISKFDERAGQELENIGVVLQSTDAVAG
jgi:hypothetical protein